MNSKKVKKGVYLFSCKGGAGNEGNNVAWMFAKLTSSKVYACTGSVSYSKIFGKYYARKHGIGELSKHFIIRKNIFFGVQILRKVRQDNGESRSEIIEKNIWLLSAIIFIVILLGGIYLRLDKVNMDSVKKVEVCFQYGNTNAINQLSDREVASVKTIFNGKKLYKDNLSCGFSEAVSIKFDDEHTFCIARDTCPIVYWEEKNRYIRLTEDEKTQLYNLLEPYGFIFPCV